MWEFASAHPVWFFVYLSTMCLTVSVVAGSLATIFRKPAPTFQVTREDLDELAKDEVTNSA